jgi:hypothetical protein
MGVTIQITLLLMEYKNCLQAIENVVERAELCFDQIFTDSIQILMELGLLGVIANRNITLSKPILVVEEYESMDCCDLCDRFTLHPYLLIVDKISFYFIYLDMFISISNLTFLICVVHHGLSTIYV